MSISSVLLALASGVLTALCLPRLGLCVLGWFSLIPLFLAWGRSKAWKDSALLGFCAGFAYHGTALYWVYNTCRFAGLSVFVGLLAWAALAGVLALNWALTGALGARAAERHPGFRPWAWAAVWTAVAFAAERWTPRLATDFLSYTQWRHLPMIQVGALAGPHALGFLVAAANASLAEARRGGSRRHLWLVALLIGGTCGYGTAELASRREGAGSRIELLQPCIDQYQKWEAASETRVRASFDELLARPRAAAPTLIVWPESAMTRLVEGGRGLETAQAWSRKLGAFQVVGAVSKEGGETHNSAFLLGPDGEVRGSYHKRQLVPFGEFVPLPFLERFIGILAQLGGLTPGAPDQPLLATPLGPAAGGICYEAAFPRWERRDAARGARVLFNLTNDGWYKDTWGPYQHFQMNVFRAVENRATVIRSGNTGISAVIDPWGVTTARLGLNEPGRLDASVPIEDFFPRRSFYVRHGDWLGWLCLAATALLLL